MGEKLIVGPIPKGLRTDVLPFNVDNDAFPYLLNAYQWRGRVKRRRGTDPFCRLQRFLGTTDSSGNLTVTILPTPIASGIITVTVGTVIFTDPGGNSPVTLISNTANIAATLNRSTGVLQITSTAILLIANASVFYYPSLPAMGIEDLILESSNYPGNLGFDTTYSYNLISNPMNASYDVSFYKNPPASASMPGYTAKTTPNVTRTSWNGQNYQQFWTVNYQGALWATNGVPVPFNTSNIGMQFASPLTTPALTAATYVSATSMTFTVVGNPLVVGDFVFVNEFSGGTGLNWQTGYVTASGNTFTVKFPFATISNNSYTGGMVQYLTNRSNASVDCLRWYDGDPTNGSITAPTLTGGNGWVNFAPPLSQGKYSIADLPQQQYYLVGAKMIVPFRDRLLFLGPVVQTSSPGSQIYLRDTVIYSQDGTPYYTASYTNSPSATTDTPASSTITFNPLLVPVNQTATAPAYFEDQAGFGGFQSVGVDMSINTAFRNEDVYILGLDTLQTRLVFTGNDVTPFDFYSINSELGSGSTFSGVILDKGVLTKGSRGYIITAQTESARIDLLIPDQVFQTNLQNNGAERVTAVRDYINEWIFFTYPGNQSENQTSNVFPNQTLFYNYRDGSWAIFDESYTTYGTLRPASGLTWATAGKSYPTWEQWTVPWNAGLTTALNPVVLAGNQQGYIVIRNTTIGEAPSLSIQNISGNTITVPNHCLNTDDFIIINSVQGTVSQFVNQQTFQVELVDANTITLSPGINSGTYLGGGTITRIYNPYIQTKQFPTAWSMARKVRIGAQQYLLSKTAQGQISLLIFLSENDNDPYNDGPIIPQANVANDSLIYSTVLYTCPESTNLGLTPANINLQMPTASSQQQIWHRMNTSLIGDTVQLGFTMSNEQLYVLTPTSVVLAITGATQATSCVISCNNADADGNPIIVSGQTVQVIGITNGMTQLNSVPISSYVVLSSNTTSVTINLDSTGFTAYTSGGSIFAVANFNQFSEIELHGFVLDLSPSQLLA